MKSIDNPYEPDFYNDDVEFIRLTKKNVSIVNLLISFDSAYRIAEDDTKTTNLKSLFKNKKSFLGDDSDIYEIVKRTDKENSTHLSSLGPKYKHQKSGIKLTADWIKKNIDEVRKKIQSSNIDDHNEIVSKIANATEVKNNFSFATKFCCYSSAYGLNDPNRFSIFDNIVSLMIPYYYARFCHKKLTKTDMERIRKNCNYKKYQEYIDQIIEESNKFENYKISRRDFDHLIWYYYKGDRSIIDDSYNKLKIFIK